MGGTKSTPGGTARGMPGALSLERRETSASAHRDGSSACSGAFHSRARCCLERYGPTAGRCISTANRTDQDASGWRYRLVSNAIAHPQRLPTVEFARPPNLDRPVVNDGPRSLIFAQLSELLGGDPSHAKVLGWTVSGKFRVWR